MKKTNTKTEYMFFGLLANEYSRAILSLTSKKECSAQQLSQELDMPVATVYRKLNLLEDAELIRHVKTIINLWGNEEKYYRCAIREVTVNLHDGTFSIGLKKEECSDKIVRLWKRLAKPDSEELVTLNQMLTTSPSKYKSEELYCRLIQ